jgi:DNA-binding transcriptional LysR family regulator
MELRHLRYFVAAGEAQHFRRAAQMLHVAQPAMSRQIKDLEGELEVELFDRLRRGVKLSEPGKAFLADAKRILAAVDAAIVQVRRVARGKVGTIRIAFSEVGAWHGVVPESIRAFCDANPDVELAPLPMSSSEQIEALHQGRIDAGFVYAQLEPHPDFLHHRVAEENVLLALQDTHRLAAKPVIWLRDLRDEPLIWTSREANATFYKQLMEGCLAGGLAPRIVQEVSTGATALSLVAVGMGCGMVTSAMRWVSPSGMVLKPIKNLSVPFRLDLVVQRKNRSPVLAQFVQTTLEVHKKLQRAGAPPAARRAARKTAASRS